MLTKYMDMVPDLADFRAAEKDKSGLRDRH